MRAKLTRFTAAQSMPNIIQEGKPLFDIIKGRWNTEFFKNNQPIVLELGCGRGEYTIGLARIDPSRNYIGIDIKGDRLWRGAQYALDESLGHVAFLRAGIENLDKYFAPSEIAEIWITFADPRPKDKDEKHRLTNSSFVELYDTLLSPDGWVKFKTDSTFLFDYTLEHLQRNTKIKNLEYTFDLYDSELQKDHFDIKTRFEQKFHTHDEKIKYLKFQYLT
jgi:tRNA (guanine-N7-)-methyltransferase